MLKIPFQSLFLFIFVLTTACASSETQVTQFVTRVGWVEPVRVYPVDFLLDAKVDTGADSCSVHAENITTFKKGKKHFVRFEMLNRFGKRQTLEREVLSHTKIKTKDGKFQVRPVVRVGLCLSNNLEFVACNLVDRSNFQYPILVGRNYLAGKFLVDSSDSYLTNPNCEN